MTLLENTTSILQPCDQGAIAYVKSKYKQWYNLSLFEDTANNTFQKIEKITTIIENMPANIIKFSWFKSGLLQTQCDQELFEKDLADTDNHENLLENEAIYDDDRDEEVPNGNDSDEFVVLELVEEPPKPPKKTKQSKMTSFLC